MWKLESAAAAAAATATAAATTAAAGNITCLRRQINQTKNY